jgi:hypothetical protein
MNAQQPNGHPESAFQNPHKASVDVGIALSGIPY